MRPSSIDHVRRGIVVGGAAIGLSQTAARAFAAPVALRSRLDIASSAGRAMIKLYADAVTAMQNPALQYPPQPSSWIFQSYIHSVPVNPFDPANSNGLMNGTPAMKTRIDEIYGMPASGTPQANWKEAASACWGTCTHSSPYFTIWHRWYMYYFERICRAMCGNDNFTLPYWNYASNIGSSLLLPAAFQNSSPYKSLIFDDRGLGFANPQGNGPQNVAMNTGGYLPYPQTQYNDAIAAKGLFPSDVAFAQPPQPAYFAFGLSGRLECVPHDLVHGNVGGWMGNVPSAAGDPIFYMHHCQIDRLFATWEGESGSDFNFGTDPSNQPSKASWMSHQSSFVDETGKLIHVMMGDALSTKVLGYEYDKLATSTVAVAALTTRALDGQVAGDDTVKVAAMRSDEIRVSGAGVSVTLKPTPTLRGDAATESLDATKGAASPAATTLVLHDLKLLRRPPAPLNVFLNLPAGTAPDLNGPYFVATINLFNVPIGGRQQDVMPGMAMPTRDDLRFDVKSVLDRQGAEKLWNGGPISVTITTLGVDRAAEVTYVTFDHASLEP